MAKMAALRRRYWTPEEDERLVFMVGCWSDKRGKDGHWDKISQFVGTRTAKECRARWFQCLHPNLRRGKWTREEDEKLKSAYKRLGPAWASIAREIPGRTDDQCSKRFNDVLNPKVQQRLRPWSSSEDKLLLELFERYGPKWQQISRIMMDRTGLTCRNRWRKLTTENCKAMPLKGSEDFTASQGMLYDTPELDVNGATDSTLNGFLESLGSPELGPETHTYTVALEPYHCREHDAIGAAINEHDMARLLELASVNNQKIVINHYLKVGDEDLFLGTNDQDVEIATFQDMGSAR